MDFALARFDVNGVLDPAFGVGGSVKTDFLNAIDYAKDVTLQTDGKIVAAGWINPDPADVERFVDFGVARYNSNGVLDPTFGNGGIISTDFGHVDQGGGVAIQADCSIVVAGYSWPLETGNGDFALARYQGDGCSVPPPSTNACPRGQGYWKNHPENWPVQSLMLGARVYTKAELIALLKTPARGNASIILSYQLIAAKLNIANGSNGASVASQIAQADGILAGYTGALPYGIVASTGTGQTLTEISELLDSYNSGDRTDGCAE